MRINVTEQGESDIICRYGEGRLVPVKHQPVREVPVKLVVNGRELATLIGSPHELRFLVGGFLRLQGFAKDIDDFLALAICEDVGTASVTIRGEVPDQLRPVLTTGCGTGVTFSLPDTAVVAREGRGGVRFSPTAVFALMEELSQRSERYRSHGGIHSAAVGNGSSLVLYAEDIGRHNTLDRIAGEALFRQIDLRDMMLVTSGRVSSEMAAKAASLGIALVASRTSPTDMAARICNAAGIALLGYVRGGRFNVYSHAELLDIAPPEHVSSEESIS